MPQVDNRISPPPTISTTTHNAIHSLELNLNTGFFLVSHFSSISNVIPTNIIVRTLYFFCTFVSLKRPPHPTLPSNMTFVANSSSSLLLSPSEQHLLVEKLQVFTIQGRDKHDRPLLRIIGKYFPARLLSVETCVKFLEEKIFPNLGDKPFSVLYVHTGVDRRENFPGMLALRSMYEAMPSSVRENLQTLYFLHPSLQSRLFLATFGRLIFSGGLYWKLKYVERLDLLWNKVKRKEVDVPEFVYDEDEEMERRSCVMDFGPESDHPRLYHSPAFFDNAVPLYSTRCGA